MVSMTLVSFTALAQDCGMLVSIYYLFFASVSFDLAFQNLSGVSPNLL